MIAARLIEHPLFPMLADHIKIETYARDGGHNHPRKRIELAAGSMQYEQVCEALEIEVKCCRCGRAIRPFRARKANSNRMELARHIYIAVACDLETSVGCSRGRAAREAYIEIEQEVHRRRCAWTVLSQDVQARRHPTQDAVQIRREGDLLPDYTLTSGDVAELRHLLGEKKEKPNV